MNDRYNIPPSVVHRAEILVFYHSILLTSHSQDQPGNERINMFPEANDLVTVFRPVGGAVQVNSDGVPIEVIVEVGGRVQDPVDMSYPWQPWENQQWSGEIEFDHKYFSVTSFDQTPQELFRLRLPNGPGVYRMNVKSTVDDDYTPLEDRKESIHIWIAQHP